MSGVVRYCWRCDEPITKERPGTSAVKVSISAGGAVVWLHKKCPKRPELAISTPR
ncbi:hypothetical protein [Streptomyces huasconensis]|uniref:hypothetical protein n=1 Tax=Streptomyces huasconensis TaxID=1854574 RepID=UPI00370279C5